MGEPSRLEVVGLLALCAAGSVLLVSFWGHDSILSLVEGALVGLSVLVFQRVATFQSRPADASWSALVLLVLCTAIGYSVGQTTAGLTVGVGSAWVLGAARLWDMLS